MENEVKRFCKAAHGSQKRKYTFEPYWTHPFAVAELVKSVTDDVNVVYAAYLHDVVEDTKVTLFHIELEFGAKVAKMVHEVTNVSSELDGNRKERKKVEREFLAKASPEAQTIKLADMIHNMLSIMLNDSAFAKIYMREKRELLNVLTEGHPVLYSHAEEIIDFYFDPEELDE